MQINTKTIGDRSAIAVIKALIHSGKNVSMPFGDNLRYDIVFEDKNKFYRVQIKTAKYRKKSNSLFFEPNTRKKRNGVYVRKPYLGEVDFIGVYFSEQDKVYLVPLKDTVVSGTILRLLPAKNNQKKLIRYASKYEVKSVEAKI